MSLSRASYLKEAGDLEGAVRDSDRAIELRGGHCAAAFSLRSRLRLQQLEEAHAEKEEDDGEGGVATGSAQLSGDELALLQQAAEDGLLGKTVNAER